MTSRKFCSDAIVPKHATGCKKHPKCPTHLQNKNGIVAQENHLSPWC